MLLLFRTANTQKKMERDLSLIEISGEDDSLISLVQQSPNDNVFSCSPLLRIPRSSSIPPHSLLSSPIPEEEEDTSKPSCEDNNNNNNNNNNNKENVNLNKQQEGPKLSIEPQQMKRKKKGGGYNLRKSLAWDRAFFTDEGVLDPSELSMLSGNVGKSSREMLSVIHEGRESLSANSPNLSKELPSSTPNRGRKVAALSPKFGSPARPKIPPPSSVAKRKVLATHDINRSASKRTGCPPPLASSSLKRPSSTKTAKVVTKDLRASKLLAPKPDPPVVSTSSRGSVTSAGHPNRNISKPGNAQRNVGLKGTSTNTKTARNDAKSGPSGKLITKSTAQRAKKNVVKVSSGPEIQSSSNSQSQTKVSLEVVSDSIVPATRTAYGPDSNTRNTAVSSSQNGCYNGGNVQPTQPQTAKPSGLRMPSPSLGLFDQKIAVQSKPFDSMLQRSSPACNHAKFNIPNFSKAGALNPIQQRPPRPSGNIPVCSSTIHSLASTDAASSGKIKSNLEYSPKSHDTINLTQQLHNFSDDVDQQSLHHAEPCKMEKITCMENKGQQSNEIKLSLQIGPSEQLEKGVDRSAVDICPKTRKSSDAGLDFSHFSSPLSLPVQVEGLSATSIIDFNQHVEDRQYEPGVINLSACSESQSAEVDDFGYDAAVEVQEDQLSGTHEAKRQSSQQAEPMKFDTCMIDPISNVESHMLNGMLLEESRSSEELNDYCSLGTADVLLEVHAGGTTSYCPSHCKDVEPMKDSSTGIDYLIRELDAGDAQALFVEGNLLAESGMTVVHTSSLVNSNLMIMGSPSAKSAEQSELPNPCFVTEQVFQDNCGPFSNSCLVCGNEDYQEKNFLQPAELRRTDDFGCELGSSSILSSITAANQDCGFDETGNVEYLHQENALLASVDSNQVAEKFSHDVELCSEANTLGFESMDETNMIGAVITDNVEVNNLGPNRGDLSGSKFENPHVTAQISPIMRVKFASRGTNNSEREGAIDKQFEKNLIPFSDSQPENDTCNERCSDILHSDYSSGILDAKEQTAEQDELRNSRSHEAGQVNHRQVCDDLLSDKSRSFEDAIAIDGSGSEMTHSPRKSEIVENELAGVDNSKETFLEDAKKQYLDESSLADKEQDALAIRPPSNAVPFSDEWLAALEAAGEEVLARKGGAVQNSPTDKSQPEPSPWSPVRRKNNQGIGPYDCTKFTNTNNPSSTSD